MAQSLPAHHALGSKALSCMPQVAIDVACDRGRLLERVHALMTRAKLRGNTGDPDAQLDLASAERLGRETDVDRSRLELVHPLRLGATAWAQPLGHILDGLLKEVRSELKEDAAVPTAAISDSTPAATAPVYPPTAPTPAPAASFAALQLATLDRVADLPSFGGQEGCQQPSVSMALVTHRKDERIKPDAAVEDEAEGELSVKGGTTGKKRRGGKKKQRMKRPHGTSDVTDEVGLESEPSGLKGGFPTAVLNGVNGPERRRSTS